MISRVRFALVATCLFVLSVVLLPGAHAAGQDLQEMPIGQVVNAQTTGETPAAFQFTAAEAGFLTVIVRGDGEADLRIQVTDEVGFPLPGGTSDIDANGDLSAEQLTVAIPRAGVYQVYVNVMYGSALLDIGGT